MKNERDDPRVPVFRRFSLECYRRRVRRMDISQETFLAY